jgi:hypothetical protein
MVQTRTRTARGSILPRTATVSQTNRRVVVQMQTSKTETGLTWRSVSGLETRLRRRCGPAMLSMLPAQVSAVGARARVQVLVQGVLFVSVPMKMMLKHCSAGWRKASLLRLPPLRTLMVVLVVPPADRL